MGLLINWYWWCSNLKLGHNTFWIYTAHWYWLWFVVELIWVGGSTRYCPTGWGLFVRSRQTTARCSSSALSCCSCSSVLWLGGAADGGFVLNFCFTRWSQYVPTQKLILRSKGLGDPKPSRGGHTITRTKPSMHFDWLIDKMGVYLWLGTFCTLLNYTRHFCSLIF